MMKKLLIILVSCGLVQAGDVLFENVYDKSIACVFLATSLEKKDEISGDLPYGISVILYRLSSISPRDLSYSYNADQYGRLVHAFKNKKDRDKIFDIYQNLYSNNKWVPNWFSTEEGKKYLNNLPLFNELERLETLKELGHEYDSERLDQLRKLRISRNDIARPRPPVLLTDKQIRAKLSRE